MPIFEYRCKGCGAFFEAIVSASTPAVCPKCTGVDLEKQLSVFAVGTSPRTGYSGPCGDSLPESCRSCGDPRGPGSCALN